MTAEKFEKTEPILSLKNRYGFAEAFSEHENEGLFKKTTTNNKEIAMLLAENKALQSQINKLLEKYNPVIGLRNVKQLKRKDNR